MELLACLVSVGDLRPLYLVVDNPYVRAQHVHDCAKCRRCRSVLLKELENFCCCRFFAFVGGMHLHSHLQQQDRNKEAKTIVFLGCYFLSSNFCRTITMLLKNTVDSGRRFFDGTVHLEESNQGSTQGKR